MCAPSRKKIIERTKSCLSLHSGRAQNSRVGSNFSLNKENQYKNSFLMCTQSRMKVKERAASYTSLHSDQTQDLDSRRAISSSIKTSNIKPAPSLVHTRMNVEGRANCYILLSPGQLQTVDFQRAIPDSIKTNNIKTASSFVFGAKFRSGTSSLGVNKTCNIQPPSLVPARPACSCFYGCWLSASVCPAVRQAVSSASISQPVSQHRRAF